MNSAISPRASVCIPVRNGQKYLRASIDSVLGQTVRDIELIICDNASTDATASICRGYAARDSRVRYVRHETNIGPAANFNSGLELARGEYFHWQAHDDIIAPDFLQRCIEALDSDPSAVLAYPRATIIDDHENEIEPYNFVLDTGAANATRRFRELVLVRCREHKNFEVFGVMRTSVARQIPGHGAWAHGDRVFTVRLALRGRLVCIEPRLFFARCHSAQSMQMRPTRVLPGAGKSVLARWLGPGPLPPPEWWDPQLAYRICFPDWNLLRQYANSVSAAPLTFGQRWKCRLVLGEWVARYWMKLARDVAFAGETVVLRAVERMKGFFSEAPAGAASPDPELNPVAKAVSSDSSDP
jgi:Glycosyl transferase family 2